MWECIECSQTFDESAHCECLCLVDDKFIFTCTHHPEILNRATVILASRACALRYAVRHPKHAFFILKLEATLLWQEKLEKARDMASRN